MSVSLRKATLDDLEDIYRIELGCFGGEAFPKPLFRYFLRSPDFVTLIAVLGGKPVGFVTGSFERPKDVKTGHIYSIDVQSEYRRRGIGSQLLKAIEGIFAENEAVSCRLEVHVDNVAATKLYLKHGYKPLETLKNYYGFGADGIRLEKNLITS